MRILVEDLLQWDPVQQVSNGKGTLGTVVVFDSVDKEQGRKTLHSHWKIWLEQLSHYLQEKLSSESHTVQKKEGKGKILQAHHHVHAYKLWTGL